MTNIFQLGGLTITEQISELHNFCEEILAEDVIELIRMEGVKPREGFWWIAICRFGGQDGFLGQSSDAWRILLNDFNNPIS